MKMMSMFTWLACEPLRTVFGVSKKREREREKKDSVRNTEHDQSALRSKVTGIAKLLQGNDLVH